MRRPRRNHTASFKAKVAIAALKGDETLGPVLNQASQTKAQVSGTKDRKDVASLS
jgi:transposase